MVVGRCAETALQAYDSLVRVFVMGDKQSKLAHIMKKFDLSENEAEVKMNRHDLKRKAYHNRYSENKWGDSRGYDLCVNSSRLGVEKTARMIVEYVNGCNR